MHKPLSFLSAGVSLTLALTSLPSHALDAWELYQQAKPDQVGVIAASKIAREQCTKENESTPCNNIGNVLRVFRKQGLTTPYEDKNTPEKKPLFDEGKLWCPHFKDTKQAISLYTEDAHELRANFKKNLNDVKNSYHIQALFRFNADRTVSSFTNRMQNIIETAFASKDYEEPCNDFVVGRTPFFSALNSNEYLPSNKENPMYAGPILDIEDDITTYLWYGDDERPLDKIIKYLDKAKNSPIGLNFNPNDEFFQPKVHDFVYPVQIHKITDDIYSDLEDSLNFQHRKDIPDQIRSTRLKRIHAIVPLNPIVTAQYLDSLIATKNKSEIVAVQNFLEWVAQPLMQTERKSGISKLQDRPYFGNPRYTKLCTIYEKCSADEISNIGMKIKKMLEASELLRQKSELYEAAAKQVKKQGLPKYYENYFLYKSALYSKYSVELKWDTDQWRGLAKKVASQGSDGNYGKTNMEYNTIQSYSGNNAEQSGEGASSNFNRMIESSRPYLKGKDLQRLNQYQNGMDLLNSIMGQ